MGRFRWLLIFAVLALTPVMAFAGPEEDAGAVVDHWATAFNSNDVDALVGLYTPDAILIGTTGLSPMEGSNAVRSYFARVAKSGDKVAIDGRKISVLGDKVAYATWFYTFDVMRNGERRKSSAAFTMVLVKHRKGWLIAHHHSSRRPVPPPSPIRRG